MSQLQQPSPAATPAPAPTKSVTAPTLAPAPTESVTAPTTTVPLSASTTLAPTVSNSTLSGIANSTSGEGSGSQNHTGVSIPINSPAGGIIMTKPPQSSISFYKIAPNEIVTFGWNFTYILQDSEKLTVSAICENGNTYPVGPTDGVIPGTATEVAWDLHSWQVNNPGEPLAQGTYALTMWDNRGRNALPQPGLLRPYNNLKFALYTPQPYLPLDSGWSCPGCHSHGAGVLSAVIHPSFVGFVVSTLVILLSGFHLLRPNA